MTQLSYFFPGEGKKQFKVISEADLAACVRALSKLSGEQIVNFFATHRTIAALNEALNSGNDPQFDVSANPARAMHAVILARLADDPRFESIVAGYDQQLRKFPAAVTARFLSLVNYLRTAANVGEGQLRG